MFVQIEITTHCNFTCFFCAGRDMPQRHMDMATYQAVLDRIPPGQHVVSLQGEGEPMVHPDFWTMVVRLRERGWIPYAITNGSRIDVEKLATMMPRIAFSLDTIDPAEAERIGRKHLDKVLDNLDRLLARIGPQRITIMTVDYGQPLRALIRYVQARGIMDHIVQPLQMKDDYRLRYPDRPVPPKSYTYRCRFLEHPQQLFFDLDGGLFPCCYIKNPAGYESPAQLRALLDQHEVPACCRGCREILAAVPQPIRIQAQSASPMQASIRS